MPVTDGADEANAAFYDAYGNISARFGLHDGDTAAEALMPADVASLPAAKVAPSASHSLCVFVECCTAKRPSGTLRGSAERYSDAHAALESAILDACIAASWTADQLTILRNPHPAQSPYSFMPREEAAGYKGRVGTMESYYYLHELGESTREQLRTGAMVLDSSEFPPQLCKYPRIGALEVTYQLLEEDRVVAQRLIFSKLTVNKFPHPTSVAHGLVRRVQLDIYQQSASHAAHAKASKQLAKQQELDVANAERTVDREREQLAIAAAEMRRVEAELHAAQAAGDATSIRAAEDALRAVRERADLEAQNAKAAIHTANLARVKQKETLARAEVAEARQALQVARKELAEWEAAQRTLESTLEKARAYARDGDSTAAMTTHEHAQKLRVASERELGEVRSANDSAAKELLEAVEALVQAAEARVAMYRADEGSVDADAERRDDSGRGAADSPEFGTRPRVSWEFRAACKRLSEALVQREDAEAQVAMISAELELKEALSLMLQAKIAFAAAEDAIATSDRDESDALSAARSLKRRALREADDARTHIEKAATEAMEAADARLRKEVLEVEEIEKELAEAEALLSMETHGGSSEFRGYVMQLREYAAREAEDLSAARLNVDMAKSEISAKRAEVEQSIFLANAASAQISEQRTASIMAEHATQERAKADEAETKAARLEAEAEDARKTAVAAGAFTLELEKTHGKRSSVAMTAKKSEAELKHEAHRLRGLAQAAADEAFRERVETQLVEIEKEEAEAQLAFEHYLEVDELQDAMRDRLSAAMHHVTQAEASGETGLEHRALEVAAGLQDKLAHYNEQAQAAFERALKEEDEAASTRERVENEQALMAEAKAAKAIGYLREAEEQSGRAMQELQEYQQGTLPKAAEVRRLQNLLDDANVHTEAMQGLADAAHKEMENEREEAGAAAVARAQRHLQMKEHAHELAEEIAGDILLHAEITRKRAAIAELSRNPALQLKYDSQAELLNSQAEAARRHADATARDKEDAQAAVAAAILRKEQAEAQEAESAAVLAEAAANHAEREAANAVSALGALRETFGKRTRLSDTDQKRLAKAELDERELVAKAKRLRDDAHAKRERADKEAADLAATLTSPSDAVQMVGAESEDTDGVAPNSDQILHVASNEGHREIGGPQELISDGTTRDILPGDDEESAVPAADVPDDAILYQHQGHNDDSPATAEVENDTASNDLSATQMQALERSEPLPYE